MGMKAAGLPKALLPQPGKQTAIRKRQNQNQRQNQRRKQYQSYRLPSSPLRQIQIKLMEFQISFISS